MSDALAAGLAALGVAKGDRVALFLNNCPQYVIAHFAIQKLGAVVGPCSPLFKQAELEYQLRDLGAQVVIAADVAASGAVVGTRRDVDPACARHRLRRPAACRRQAHGQRCRRTEAVATPVEVPAELLAQRRIPDGAIDLMSIIGPAQAAGAAGASGGAAGGAVTGAGETVTGAERRRQPSPSTTWR